MAYAEQLKSPKWQRRRLEILSRDNFTCTLCKNSENTLHVHHKYYVSGLKPWEHEDEALTTLCEDCHDIVEFLKKEELAIIGCYLLTRKDGTKSHMICTNEGGFCFMWEFRKDGDLNGKELVICLPFHVMEDIYGFLKENKKNG